MKAIETCGKKRYPDEYKAQKQLNWILRKAAADRKLPLRYYYHSECKGFHLTSKPLKEENEIVIWPIVEGTG